MAFNFKYDHHLLYDQYERNLKQTSVFYRLLNRKERETKEMHVPNENDVKEARFLKAGGKLPEKVVQNVPVKDTASDLHYSKILSGTSKDIWYGKDKSVYIIDMHDRHLVNAVKFLLTHCNAIIDEFNFRWGKTTVKDLPGAMINFYDKLGYDIRKANNKVSKLTLMIPCFTTLAEEIVKRFGYRALNALYEEGRK